MTDSEVVAIVKQTRNKKHFEQIIKRYQQSVYRKALVFAIGNTNLALKISIDTFVEIWNSILADEYEEPIDKWINKITAKVGYDYYRDIKKK